MANTFSQIYLQFVFAVKHRQCLIHKQNKEELHKYITGLVQNRKSKLLAVHCMPDHTHLFVGFKPSILIADFVKEKFPMLGGAVDQIFTSGGGTNSGGSGFGGFGGLGQ